MASTRSPNGLPAGIWPLANARWTSGKLPHSEELPMEELNPIPEVAGERVVPPPAKLPKPINTARIALYMVIAICLLGLISNLAHFGSANAARNMPKSLQPAKPGVTSLDALAGFQRQQAEDALRLEKEREAAERLLGSARESLQRSKESTLLPCDAAL